MTDRPDQTDRPGQTGPTGPTGPTSPREPASLLGVAAWIGVVASAVTLVAGLVYLVQGVTDDSELAGLGVLAFVVLAAMAGIGIALSVAVLRVRARRPQAAAVLALVLGAALLPIWSAGLSSLSSGLPRAVGALQQPVPLAVLGLAVVSLVRLRQRQA